MNARLLFGSIIAVVLLVLYADSLVEAIMLALKPGVAQLSAGLDLTLTTVGGLVSALVIADLSITKPGDTPGAKALTYSALVVGAAPAKPINNRIADLIGTTFVIVWIVLGVAAYYYGVMRNCQEKALTDFGQEWLGLAIAAGYAYFGISR